MTPNESDCVSGNIEEARGILKGLEEAVPGLAMVRLRRVSLERRHGNMEEAESLLQDAIRNGKSVGETSFYSIKLARQLLKLQRSLERARKVLLEAIERDKVRRENSTLCEPVDPRFGLTCVSPHRQSNFLCSFAIVDLIVALISSHPVGRSFLFFELLLH